MAEGESCFGTPTVRMPTRQAPTVSHADHLLFSPRRRDVATRLLIEAGRIWLPRMAIIFALVFGLDIFETSRRHIGAVYSLLMLPLFEIFLLSLPALILTIGLKWTLVGRYTRDQWPLWSRKVWLSEFVTSTFESLLAPILLVRLVGTPYLAMILRLLGAKIGDRCTLMSHDMTEWDMVTLGDGSVLNLHAGPQTHLFEDRVMKVGTVELGNRAVMRGYAICLPDSSLGEETVLGSLSLVMKGEQIPPFQTWQGAPVRKVLGETHSL